VTVTESPSRVRLGSPQALPGGARAAVLAGHTAVRAERLPGLDALRAVAAACVAVMHLGAIYGTPSLISSAYLAVDLFFLLSGFVMARTYEQRMRASRIGPGAFLAARYRRLWPTMVIGAALSLPFLIRDSASLAMAAQSAILNILLLPAFAAPEIFPLNTPAWSVFFELLANFAHALLLWRLGRTGLAILVLLAGCGLIACALHFGHLDIGSRQDNMIGGLARVAFAYGLGVLLWRLHGDRAPLAVPAWLGLLAMPVLFAAASWLGLRGWIFDLPFVIMACPLMLWASLRFDAPRLAGVTSFAGALSFPLYAVHYPLLLGAEALKLPEAVAAILALLGTAAAMVAAERMGRRR